MARMILHACMIGVISLASHAGPQNAHTLVYRAPESSEDLRHDYYIKLLEMALLRTADNYGILIPKPTEIFVSQDRAFDLVSRGIYVDIVWGMTSNAREQRLAAIPVPLLKGLLGCRVAIIRKDLQGRLASVRTIQDLQQFIIVQGNGWPDARILRHNGLNVVTAADYQGMFAMILNGRADLFFRGITEAWNELDTIKQTDLVVDNVILLTYPGPIYFFVNKNRLQLARRIREGLERAMDDGSFDALLEEHPHVVRARQELAGNTRRILSLVNPDLPAETPLLERKFWTKINVGGDKLKCTD